MSRIDHSANGRESLEQLTKRLHDGLDVYVHYMTQLGYHDFRPYKKFKSPFRVERHGSFQVYKHQSTGVYWHTDFAYEKAGNHWTFVMRLYGLEFADAVKKIKQDILGELGGVSNQVFLRQNHAASYTKDKEKGSVVIETERRDWTLFDQQYWDCFNASAIVGQAVDSLAELEDLHLYGAASFYMKTAEKEFTKREVAGDPMYDVCFPQADQSVRHKMYRPLTADRKFKFGPSNIDGEKDMFGFHLLPAKCKTLFLTAGQKDTFAFRLLTGRQLPCFCLSSETAHMPGWLPSFLSLIAENVYTVMNNDKTVINAQGKAVNAGKQATRYFEKEYGYLPAQEPLFTYDVNDVADLVHGLKAVQAHDHLCQVRDYYLSL